MQKFLSLFAASTFVLVSACSQDNPAEHADGASLRVDVVAPKEPEIIASSGQLSVGELNNGYDHQLTMERARQYDEPAEDVGTSWDDDSWAYAEGTGPAIVEKEVPAKPDPKLNRTYKSGGDFEG